MFSIISIFTSLVERCVLQAGTVAEVVEVLPSVALFSVAVGLSVDVAAALNEGDFVTGEDRVE